MVSDTATLPKRRSFIIVLIVFLAIVAAGIAGWKSLLDSEGCLGRSDPIGKATARFNAEALRGSEEGRRGKI